MAAGGRAAAAGNRISTASPPLPDNRPRHDAPVTARNETCYRRARGPPTGRPCVGCAAGARMANEAGERRGPGGTVAPLTRSEHDVLAASARGAGVVEVARGLGLPEREVRAGLASAVRKLGARSKLEAVLIALRRGDIEV